MATLAFLLLIAALVLFTVSTRQWPIAMRGLAWGGGLLLLIVAWMSLGSSQRDPELATAFADFFAKLTHPGDSMLVRMLASNGDTVARIFLSVFDIFAVLAVLAGIVALIAFGPGEALERAIRPVLHGIVGAIMGGIFVLAIVGTGFGQKEERKAYAGQVTAETVHSAEMILLNGDLLRLRGIDAYEPGQPCRLQNRVQDCGAAAESALRDMLEGAYVMCARDEAPQAANAPRGERLATCSAVKNGGEEFNIARRMVEQGFAFGVDGAYADAAASANAGAKGLLVWCAVRPSAWGRLPQAKKDQFRDRGVYDKDTPVVGACPPPTAGPRPPQKQKFTPVIARPQ